MKDRATSSSRGENWQQTGRREGEKPSLPNLLWVKGWIREQLVSGRFSIRELLDLAATNGLADSNDVRVDVDDVLKTVFEWYYARTTAFIRGSVAAAATIFAAFFVAFLSGKTNIWAILLGAVVIVVLLSAALHLNLHLAHLHREYVVSLRLLHELEEFKAGLAAHVKETGGAQDPPDGQTGNAAVGAFLYEKLASIETVEYEADRKLTVQILEKARSAS